MDPPLRSSSKTWMRNVAVERLEPLNQVATYCRLAQTRYAFILTQAELVALRIRRVPKESRSSWAFEAAVEYAPVPWDAKEELTVNLAIWTLGCMGMNDEHREMETADGNHQQLEKMARLTWWVPDRERGVYENVISKRQIPADEWKKDYEDFVQLTERGGNSYTNDLARSSGAVPLKPRVAVAAAATVSQNLKDQRAGGQAGASGSASSRKKGGATGGGPATAAAASSRGGPATGGGSQAASKSQQPRTRHCSITGEKLALLKPPWMPLRRKPPWMPLRRRRLNADRVAAGTSPPPPTPRSSPSAAAAAAPIPQS
ncbi:hypothetical protein VTH06DRAFT_3214 [Thermothelomyces fergusii]